MKKTLVIVFLVAAATLANAQSLFKCERIWNTAELGNRLPLVDKVSSGGKHDFDVFNNPGFYDLQYIVITDANDSIVYSPDAMSREGRFITGDDSMYVYKLFYKQSVSQIDTLLRNQRLYENETRAGLTRSDSVWLGTYMPRSSSDCLALASNSDGNNLTYEDVMEQAMDAMYTPSDYLYLSAKRRNQAIATAAIGTLASAAVVGIGYACSKKNPKAMEACAVVAGIGGTLCIVTAIVLAVQGNNYQMRAAEKLNKVHIYGNGISIDL